VFLQSGKTLLFDPFDDDIGYVREDTGADIVLMSHDHHDHNSTKHIVGRYTLVREPGVFEEDGVRIEGFETWHDHEQGARRGKNIMYKVTAEGLTLLHMGDIGCIPDDDLFARLGEIDILMIPVGGYYTIDAAEALEICKRIEPNIILPMHYKTLFLNMPIAPVYNFTDLAAGEYDRSRLGGNSFELTANRLKKRPRIVLLENSLDV